MDHNPQETNFPTFLLENSQLIRQLALLQLKQQSPENSFCCSSVENLHNDLFFDENNGVEEEDEENVINDLCLLLRPKVPPSNYVCHNCFKRGHFIQNCPKGALRNQCNTPYQGFKRSFGNFVCPKCKRSWSSSNSFSEIGQECRKCKITVFPKKQFKLAKKTTDSGLQNNTNVNPIGMWCSGSESSSSDGSRSTSRSSEIQIY